MKKNSDFYRTVQRAMQLCLVHIRYENDRDCRRAVISFACDFLDAWHQQVIDVFAQTE